jgi:phospholipid/cholesterol/gamma-HCH transport system permease protein
MSFAQIREHARGRLERLGNAVTSSVWRLGFASRFLFYLVAHSGTALRRIRLTVAEIYFAGVLSLIIILVSGMFVGMVLALQGYDTLARFGASESLGVLVALSLVRELGPVVAGLLFASRAGSAITAEIGLMKATEQISAMEMMAVDPIARVVAPRFWGGVISMPLLAALFSALGIFGGYLVGVQLIGVDAGAFWSQMQAAVDLRNDILNGVIKSVVFGIAGYLDRGVRGLRCDSHRGGRVARHHAHGGDVLARDPRARFRAYRTHVYRRSVEMNRATIDLWVGIFVVIGIGALLFLALKVGNLATFSGGETYNVQGRFVNIGGLKVRAPIKSAGVVVGRVADIRFDNETYEALVSMNLDQHYLFPRDSTAKILTSGILGEQYIGLEAGGDGVMLKNGDRVRLTQSAVVLENLISQFLFNKAAEGKDEKK